MVNKLLTVLLLLIIGVFDTSAADRFGLIQQDRQTVVSYSGHEPVVQTALDILVSDSKRVTDKGFIRSSTVNKGQVVVGIPGKNSDLDQLLSRFKVDISGIEKQWEAFQLQVVGDKNESYLLVIGSDAHGAAYGVLELSRLMGISPWVWWADVAPAKKDNLFLEKNYQNIQKPSVQYRGIFLNDEDWGLTPWSAQNYEPDAKLISGIDADKLRKMETIGPKTYAQIFELLLRLRANTIWPAMHEVTVPFYFVEGNREMAERYGIYISTTHCEPLARNSATEWDITGKGDYNYVTNKTEMLNYWSQRLQELQGSDNIFTIGLRGKHDGMMQGVKTLQEHKAVLSQVIPDQRELLRRYINPNIEQVPQLFIPYKEVLDVYNDGLEVPEDVTLVWCDDNYGYIRHFPNEKERARKGGNGMYYHVSYWGRPHDYLWLSTISPALLHQQMALAYDKGVHKFWILNVGDIKPAEYQIELFLDMAWDIDQVNRLGVNQHLTNWLGQKFGPKLAKPLAAMQQEYYRLAYIRKPEHMGNTRTEEREPMTKVVKDLDWSEADIRARLQDYATIELQAERIEGQIAQPLRSAYFQLVKYPVQAAAQMNNKLLYAQLARHDKASWAQSHRAFDSIVSLTAQYNEVENGKWRGFMSYKPRNLEVFHKIKEERARGELKPSLNPKYSFSGTDFKAPKGHTQLIEGLGYAGQALAVSQGKQITVPFRHATTDSIEVEVRLVPNHAVGGRTLRFAIALEGQHEQEISYRTTGRSEEWKQNVLRNQAIRRVKLPVTSRGKQRLQLTALDEGVIVDQVLIFE